jgi:hypothetical protein
MTLRTFLEFAGLAIGVASLAYTAYSVAIGRKTARAQFWLDVRERFAKHDPVHRKLRPGGEWAQRGSGPNSPEDWADLEAYLGLFEHCEVMLSERLIDLSTFKAIYEYRIRNILANQIIVQEKLVKLAAGWLRFISLVRRLGLQIPDAAA